MNLKILMAEQMKKNTWIMIDNKGTIVWVVGRRIDDRFKITEKTSRVCQINLE